MPANRRSYSIVAVGLLLCVVAQAHAQSAGGTYALTVDGGKPVNVTSLAFGDPQVDAFGTTSSEPSELTVTTATGFAAFAAAARACTTGRRFKSAAVTYTNALGHVEYTLELKNVSVVSVLLPEVGVGTKKPNDLTWTLSAGGQHFDYELMKAPRSGLSPANRKRLERAHDRMAVLLFNRIKGNPWEAPPTTAEAVPALLFSLVIDGLKLSGVRTIGPISVERDSGRVALTPLVVTINASSAAELEAGNAARPASATLKYYRLDPSGNEVGLRLRLKNVSFKPPAKSRLELHFTGMEVDVLSPS
ncbi:MAG: hypothetical protein ACYC96_02480 [Fimbriimonadaceae bacterium]